LSAQRLPGMSRSAATSAPTWLLAVLALAGTMSMHIFVPALPRAAEQLTASADEIRLSITFYVFGLAIGQLFYGPFSDRVGRRPALLVGFGLYTIAGLAAALAPNVIALVAARLLQALGGCSGIVLSRAIVRDGSSRQEAAKRLALMNLLVTASPGVAPLVGGFLANATGWRSIFLLLSALGFFCLISIWRLVPETGAKDVESWRGLAKNYAKLLRSPTFLGFAIGGACVTTSMYAFVAAAPFIFVNQFGRPDSEVGIFLAIVVGGLWIGSVLSSRLATRSDLTRLLLAANGVSLIAAVALLSLVLSGGLSVASTLTCMFVFNLGVGLASPLALTEAISVVPEAGGSASGTYGFAQMSFGAVCTLLVGLGSNPALAAALVLLGASATGLSAFCVAMRSSRKVVAMIEDLATL